MRPAVAITIKHNLQINNSFICDLLTDHYLYQCFSNAGPREVLLEFVILVF